MSVAEGERKESKLQYVDTLYALNKKLFYFFRHDVKQQDDNDTWVIEHYRNSLLQHFHDLSHHITIANTIFPAPPNYDYWFDLRREHQKKAQASCYAMLQTLKLMKDVVEVNCNHAENLIALLEREILNIKNWVKLGNKQKKIAMNSK